MASAGLLRCAFRGASLSSRHGVLRQARCAASTLQLFSSLLEVVPPQPKDPSSDPFAGGSSSMAGMLGDESANVSAAEAASLFSWALDDDGA
mmetsp:Transcript_11742/g.39216  ORF Transcript_11742/g.39216 Transcript_11742/m.39216 type:complete len:92 (-) Transcript_11742:227-502(-)